MTDPTDDRLREHLEGSFPLEHRAGATLDEMRPRLQHSRRKYRLAQTGGAVVGIASFLLGTTLLVSSLRESTSTVDVAGGITSDDISTDEIDVDEINGDDVDGDEPGGTDPAEVVQPSSIETLPSQTTPAPSSTDATTTTTEPPTTAQPTTSEETATTDPSTTTQPTTTTTPATDTIESICGSIEVELVGSGIMLIDTAPRPGVEVDIKSSGPTEIEVGFEGNDQHCELRAENRDGQIWSDVDEDGEGSEESE